MRYFDENRNSVLDTSNYNYGTVSEAKRNLIDIFSSTNCSMVEAKQYSYLKTNMHCGWCGIPLYTIEKGIKTITESLVAHDHVYPSARYGILCKGNVLVCCKDCNSEKSDKDPVEYFRERLLRKSPTLFSSVKEFRVFLEDFTKPYKEEWPEYYKLAVEGDPTRNPTDIIAHYFIKDSKTGVNLIDLSVKPRSMRQANDPNNIIWSQFDNLNSPIYKGYGSFSAKDVQGRISYTQAFYLDNHPQKLITKLTKNQFLKFGNELILSKVESRSEVSKILRLLTILVNMPELSKFKILESHFYRLSEARRVAAKRNEKDLKKTTETLNLDRLNFSGSVQIDGLNFTNIK